MNDEPKTGLVNIGERPGVYFRNADAIVAAADLRAALAVLRRVAPWTTCEKIAELAEMLGSVRQS